MRWRLFHRVYECDDRADTALVESGLQYEEAKQLGKETERVVESHRKIRRDNHFAETFTRALRDDIK